MRSWHHSSLAVDSGQATDPLPIRLKKTATFLPHSLLTPILVNIWLFTGPLVTLGTHFLGSRCSLASSCRTTDAGAMPLSNNPCKHPSPGHCLGKLTGRGPPLQSPVLCQPPFTLDLTLSLSSMYCHLFYFFGFFETGFFSV